MAPRRPILVVGASGTLGAAFVRICGIRDLAVVPVTRADLDLTDADRVTAALDRHEPWAVINAAGYVRVDDAEADHERCRTANVVAPVTLAGRCARAAVPLVTFSSDLVFDGAAEAPYQERDRTGPLSVYGRSKAEAEQEVLGRHDRALVIRSSAFFGPWDRANFLTWVLDAVESGRRVGAARDVTVSPTYVPDLVNCCLDLLIDGEAGLWHLANGGAVSWHRLAIEALEVVGREPDGVDAVEAGSLGWRATRPRYSVLGSERGSYLPPLRDALERWAAEIGSPPVDLSDRRAGATLPAGELT